MVFFGEYRLSIDKQARIVIPSRLRIVLQNKKKQKELSLYVTRGLEKCLFVFPQGLWESQSDKLKEMPFTKGDPRAFTRLFFSGACQSTVDKQGRIHVPSHLLQYAGIKEKVVIVGVGLRVEIWDEKSWDDYFSGSLVSYAEVAEKLIE